MSARPLVLAIESSTQWLGVALLHGETLLERRREHHRGPGSERLLPLLDELLSAAGRSLDEIGAYAVSAGPGSFTGLRVGIATVKGLAFGGEAQIAAVPTLEALTHAAAVADGVVVAALDARRGELYASAARFRPGASATPMLEACVVEPRELDRRLPEGPVVWVGDAPGAAEVLRRPVEVREPPRGAPDPEWVGRLGARILAAGGGIRPEALVPRYLRRAEAEAKRTGEAFEPRGGRA